MGESDAHTIAVIHLREGLEDHYAGQANVYIATQLVLYFARGNPSGRRDPDVLFARGVVGNHRRRSFRVWEEGVMPQVLFEISSENTWQEDVGDKRTTYESIGVREYFLFDPEGHWLDPRLQGFRLVDGAYVPIAANADGSLESVELGLRLVPQGILLRLIDLQTGQMVPSRQERAEQAQEQTEQAREQAEEAQERAEQAEEQAEQARGQAEQARKQTEKARKQTEKARKQAQKAQGQAEETQKQLQQALAEVARMRAQLGLPPEPEKE
jgi:Uma2 family endonuclease